MACHCSYNGCVCSTESVQKTAQVNVQRTFSVEPAKDAQKTFTAAEQRQREVAALHKAERETEAPSVLGRDIRRQ